MRKIHISIFLLHFLSFNSYGQIDTIAKTRLKNKIILNETSNDTLYFKQIETTVKSSNEFDYKIWVPTFTALLGLLITNFVTLYKIRKDTSEAIKKDIIITKIKIEREKLEKFYDPIYTTLKSNTSIFNAYGPNTFPKDSGVLETEASQVWRQLVENVIIPNNQKIKNVILQFSHLKGDADNIELYLEYLVHLESYQYFIKTPNS